MQAIRLLTFEDLVERIQAKRSGARAAEVIAGWDRLLEVAQPLAASGDTSRGAAGAITDRRWGLERVRITGYQGVGNTTLDVELDPTPGITVLHGPNGSGKSSIADAVETALLGAPRPPAVAKRGGGQAPLWERAHRNRDASSGQVQVTLRSGAEQLVLTCRLSADDQVVGRTVEHCAGGVTTPVDLAATTWGSALAGHRPVFGYAAVERQVQLARHLQEFIEPLLAFGGCFDELKRAVTAASEDALSARKRFDDALAEAVGAVEAVDRQRRRAGAVELAALTLPAIDADHDGWLADTGLSEPGADVPEITPDHYERVAAAAEAAILAIDAVESAETSVRARLAPPLRDLHERGETLSEPGAMCPVCSTSDVPWLVTLGDALNGLVDVDHLELRFGIALGELVDGLGAVDQVVTVLWAGWCDQQLGRTAEPVVAAVSVLRKAVAQHGRRSAPPVRSALRAAAAVLGSDSWRAVVSAATEHSDHRRQWLRARRVAVEPFLTRWGEVADLGAAAASWQAADRNLRILQGELRDQRADGLRGLTDLAVRDLLSDVGITVPALTVQGTKADVGVADAAGKPLELAMLSAGQRNALLLAPLLAVAHASRFGFLVLDDPVHAFDEMRVDRLAALIHRFATHRRVIVLTHDERLKEHLLARSSDYDLRTVSRDHTDGTVVVEQTDQMWQVLLDDARQTLGLTPGAARSAVGVTDLVRGCCRMAVDEALRRFVLTEATRSARDPDPDLERLDRVSTTRERISAAQALFPSHPGPSACLTHLSPHLADWNRAAHGNPPTSSVTSAEIDAADKGCRALLGMP